MVFHVWQFHEPVEALEGDACRHLTCTSTPEIAAGIGWPSSRTCVATRPVSGARDEEHAASEEVQPQLRAARRLVPDFRADPPAALSSAGVRAGGGAVEAP